jgi:hypothetical protein
MTASRVNRPLPAVLPTAYRLLITLLAVASMLWSSSAAAIYTPNPAGRWAPGRFFLAGDFQFNSSKDLDVGSGRSHELDNMVGFFVRPSYSVARNVTIYGRLGVQGADDVDAGFAGGFGVQAAFELPRAPEWAIGGAFDYMYWDGDFSGGGSSIKWNEFQLTPAVSYRIPQLPELTPYTGILFNFVDARGSISQDDTVGFLLGTNYDPTDFLRLEAQFRAVTETGFFLSIGYLF